MPNRIIRESCRTSDTLNQLSYGAEVLFYRLTTVADDFGRFRSEPMVIKAHCFPLRVDSLQTAEVAAWLQEMAACDLIRLYTVDGKQYGYFPTWMKYQIKRADNSKFPDPQRDTSDNIGKHLPTSVNMQTSASNGMQPLANVTVFDDVGFNEGSVEGLDASRGARDSKPSPPTRGPLKSRKAKPITGPDGKTIDTKQDLITWMAKAATAAGRKWVSDRKEPWKGKGPRPDMGPELIALEREDGSILRSWWLEFVAIPASDDERYPYRQFIDVFRQKKLDEVAERQSLESRQREKEIAARAAGSGSPE